MFKIRRFAICVLDRSSQGGIRILKHGVLSTVALPFSIPDHMGNERIELPQSATTLYLTTTEFTVQRVGHLPILLIKPLKWAGWVPPPRLRCFKPLLI